MFMFDTHFNKIIRRQGEQLEALFNICESEIEKWFLVKIISFITEHPCEFSYTIICEPLEIETINGQDYLITDKGFFKDAYSGVNIVGLRIDNKINKTYFLVYPQKNIIIDKDLSDKKYRLDFSIEKYSANVDSKLLQLYCIECDGHDYHSTKEQISSDNARLRDIFLLNNYTTLRYSGSELYKWGDGDIALFLFNL